MRDGFESGWRREICRNLLVTLARLLIRPTKMSSSERYVIGTTGCSKPDLMFNQWNPISLWRARLR